MNRRITKTLVLSASAALMFGAVAAGTTYALFTSEAGADVTVSAGKVSLKAEIQGMKLYSLDAESGEVAELASTDTFTNGGTVTLNENNIALDNVTPGDKIEFDLKLTNESTVAIKYRTVIESLSDAGLFSGLKVKIGDDEFAGIKAKTDYVAVAVGSAPTAVHVSIELPVDAGDEYQGKSCELSYKAQAIQGNAFDGTYKVTPDTAQEVLDGIQGEATVVLSEGNYGKLYLRQDLDVSTRREDLDVSSYSYPAYYRQIKDLTIKAAEGATVTCDGIETEAGLFWYASAPASNQAEMNRANAGFISYLALENISIEGITFNSSSDPCVLLRDNAGQSKGATTLVDNFVVTNCKGTGDGAAGDVHFFSAGSGTTSDDFLDTGKKALNNIVIMNNALDNFYQPICMNNAVATLKNMTIKGNTFTNPVDNVIQLSNKKNEGEFIIDDNSIVSMNGRLIRMANFQNGSTIRLGNNTITTPIKYDADAPEVVKVTGVAGFNVYESNNGWANGSFTDAAKTTWISNGYTSLLPDGTYSE